ncbi:hypothetical protein EDD15DRAFT_1376169 [Pisolithus albus]|nr:hypothetical protein EDD15DRAFT_1376169 [Pisolithus albus]
MSMTVVVTMQLCVSHCSLVPADMRANVKKKKPQRWLTRPTGPPSLRQDAAVNRQGRLTKVPSQNHRRTGVDQRCPGRGLLSSLWRPHRRRGLPSLDSLWA